MDVLTVDPGVVIEQQRRGYVRYRRLEDGQRWEVHGICDRRGDCLIGAVIDGYGLIETHADIAAAQRKLGRDRIDSDLDVPVTTGFHGCCPLRIVEL